MGVYFYPENSTETTGFSNKHGVQAHKDRLTERCLGTAVTEWTRRDNFSWVGRLCNMAKGTASVRERPDRKAFVSSISIGRPHPHPCPTGPPSTAEHPAWFRPSPRPSRPRFGRLLLGSFSVATPLTSPPEERCDCPNARTNKLFFSGLKRSNVADNSEPEAEVTSRYFLPLFSRGSETFSAFVRVLFTQLGEDSKE